MKRLKRLLTGTSGGNPRQAFIDEISKNKSLLEIGPFYAPLCTGEGVKYFDILDQKELRERAVHVGQGDQVDNVPHIHYVSKTGDLSTVNETFDAIVSSHVVEHQLDFIKHLNVVSNLLNEGGKYYLIVPDKRYCFDHFNQESTIADIVNGAYMKRDKHSIKSVIEHRALTTHNDAQRHWDGDHGDISDNLERVKSAIAEFETGEYIDVHSWYFSPSSFEQIAITLKALNQIDLSIVELHPTAKGNLEFFAVLEKISV